MQKIILHINKKLLLAVVVNLILINSVVAQSISNSWDGWTLKPNSKIRMLNIFINIIYDVNMQDTSISAGNTIWPRAYNEGINNEAIPTNLLDIFDTVYNKNNLHGEITRIYGESSFDSLQITGDFVVVNLKESSVLSIGAFNTTNIFRAALQLINTNNNNNGLQTIYGHNSISDYDYGNNNKVFFTNIIIKNTTNAVLGNNNGRGDLPTKSYSIKVNGQNYCFKKGTTQGGYGIILRHEISHNLFGGDGFHTSGGNHRNDNIYMPFLTIQGGYGLMGALETGLLSCNGYERWRMHWKHPNAPNYITARDISNNGHLTSDISKVNGNQSFILRDFVTYGDAIRIKLPYKDSSTCSNQYIWLENHQVGSNNKLDYLQYSNSESCRPAGKAGIYAYYQVGRDTLSGTYGQVWYAHERDNLKVIPAEGYYDYSVYDVPAYNIQCVAGTSLNYHLYRGCANPFCGGQDQEILLGSNQIPNVDTIHFKHSKPMGYKRMNGNGENCGLVGNLIIDNLPNLGDTNDAFSTYRKINMGTNPSTCNAKTFYNVMNRTSPPYYTAHAHRNNQTTYLTGLSIEMIPQGNNIRVNIRWDDYDITNNCRWTGKISNKETVNLTSGNTIELVQNKTVAQPYRDATSGLFAKTTVLTCEENSIFTQQPDSHVIVDEKSKLLLKSGSKYVVSKNATLTVKTGCTLEVEDCAELVINGQLIVENGANINFSQKKSQILKN